MYLVSQIYMQITLDTYKYNVSSVILIYMRYIRISHASLLIFVYFLNIYIYVSKCKIYMKLLICNNICNVLKV